MNVIEIHTTEDIDNRVKNIIGNATVIYLNNCTATEETQSEGIKVFGRRNSIVFGDQDVLRGFIDRPTLSVGMSIMRDLCSSAACEGVRDCKSLTCPLIENAFVATVQQENNRHKSDETITVAREPIDLTIAYNQEINNCLYATNTNFIYSKCLPLAIVICKKTNDPFLVSFCDNLIPDALLN